MKDAKKQGVAFIPFILIVISIGILIGVFFYVFDPLKLYFERQDAKRVEDIKKLEQALMYYYRDFGRYPDYDDETFQIITDDEIREWGKSWKPYLEFLPKDPAFYKQYAYWVDRDNGFQTFRLYTSLDRVENEERACVEEGGCPGVPVKDMCGQYMFCNFGATSGNISL